MPVLSRSYEAPEVPAVVQATAELPDAASKPPLAIGDMSTTGCL